MNLQGKYEARGFSSSGQHGLGSFGKNAGANPPEKRWKYIIKQTRM